MLAIDVPDYTLDPDVTVVALALDGPIKLFDPEKKSGS